MTHHGAVNAMAVAVDRLGAKPWHPTAVARLLAELRRISGAEEAQLALLDEVSDPPAVLRELSSLEGLPLRLGSPD